MNFFYDWVVNTFPDHVFWMFYVLNFIFAAVAYKLGFARELSWQKSVIVYILLGVGNFILAVFSIMRLPITESLIIISLVLGIYRYRLHRERSAKGNEA